jgi:hypothetical protein
MTTFTERRATARARDAAEAAHRLEIATAHMRAVRAAADAEYDFMHRARSRDDGLSTARLVAEHRGLTVRQNEAIYAHQHDCPCESPETHGAVLGPPLPLPACAAHATHDQDCHHCYLRREHAENQACPTASGHVTFFFQECPDCDPTAPAACLMCEMAPAATGDDMCAPCRTAFDTVEEEPSPESPPEPPVPDPTAVQMFSALAVLVRTEAIHDWLATNDPKALVQAKAAMLAYGERYGSDACWPGGAPPTPAFTLCRACGHGFRFGYFAHPDCSDGCICPSRSRP